MISASAVAAKKKPLSLAAVAIVVPKKPALMAARLNARMGFGAPGCPDVSLMGIKIARPQKSAVLSSPRARAIGVRPTCAAGPRLPPLPAAVICSDSHWPSTMR